MVLYQEVVRDEEGMRLDRWFRRHFPLMSQGLLEKLCRKGLVRVDGGRTKAASRLAAGQTIRIPPEVVSAERPKKSVDYRLADELKEKIIYQDRDLLVINKPSGLAVQGGTKTERHIDAALPALTFDAEEAPRLVHRLDRDTSGLLLLARTRAAAQSLTRQFARREMRKVYWALVQGNPRPSRGRVDVPLAKRVGRGGGERVHAARSFDEDALRARTDYAELARAGQKFSWVALLPHTGRTHQLRVHMMAIGHPIAGDPKYRRMDDTQEFGGIIEKKLHLHARSVSVMHPSRQQILHFEAPLTGHMAQSWSDLGFDQADGIDPFEEA